MALLAALTALAYLAGAVIAARDIYGHLRARAIDARVQYHHRPTGPPDNERRLAEAKAYVAEVDRASHILGATLAAAAWPLVVFGWAAVCWLDSTPIRARAELEAERARQAARIRQLEDELGLRRDDTDPPC